jgi:hypothetical protein
LDFRTADLEECSAAPWKTNQQPGIDHGPVITTSQKDVFDFFNSHKKK